MTLISHIQKNILASVLLLSTSLATSALAEDTRLLPELSADEIAQDITREFNNRTGREELVAPTFDPFEQDSSMAGSVNLRSVGAPVTSIDGETLADGAMLDINFYYNTPSDDPYDGRGFSDIAFLSGSFAPIVKRDNRILECSRNVEDLVYDDRFYYAPLLVSLRLNRPYRHYGGHRRFGRFDRPFWRNRGYYGGHNGWSRRGYGRSIPRGGFNRDGRVRDGRRGEEGRRGDRVRDNRNDDRSRNDRNRDRNRDRGSDRRRDNRVATTPGYVRADRRGRMRGTNQRDGLRAENRTRNNREARNNREDRVRQTGKREIKREERRDVRVRQGDRTGSQGRAQARRQITNQTRAQSRTEVRQQVRTQPAKQQQFETRTRAPRSQPARTQQTRTRPARPQSRRDETRSRPKTRNSNRSRPRTIKSNNRGGSNKRNFKRSLDFFPQSQNYGRSVVRSVDIDCAREDTLSVFIPSARLDAARFDGLTVLALDKQGQEFPIFIPPNYIEGFEAAVGGRFRSQSDLGAPLPRVIYKEQGRTAPGTIVQAECPTGTQKQSDGSCLVISGRYP